LETELIQLSTRLLPKAKDHAIYGVARRLQTLRNCLDFFFEAIPPDIKSEPMLNVRAQCDAHLHAYLINCCGIFDNMAWALAFQLKLNEKMDIEKAKFDIDLFKTKFKPYLSPNLASRISEFEQWHEFLLNQRHPTAHRIPPYVIPAIQYGTSNQFDYTPYYVHDFDSSRPIPLHQQSICDMGAVLLVVDAWLATLSTLAA
jgi:hypothetical protein